MQITLMEDDGVFFGGIPRNVILVVKFDDGKQIRVPYSAEKSISALYEDLQAIAPKVVESMQQEIEESSVVEVTDKEIKIHTNKKNDHTKDKTDKSNVIEREDFVTLVRLDEGRNKDASCDLQVGKEYRVIKVIATGVTLPGKDEITQMVQGYDVVDDGAERPERTRVFPHEVALSRKRNPPPPMKEVKIEEILSCPLCNTPNACVLEGDEFKSMCDSCQNEISIKRIIRKCKTAKCGNDVALFDIGTGFKGSCNKCKAIEEVAYA